MLLAWKDARAWQCHTPHRATHNDDKRDERGEEPSALGEATRAGESGAVEPRWHARYSTGTVELASH